MQVVVFLSKHGLAAHAERLDRRGLCDDLSCLLALELPHTPTLSLTLALTLKRSRSSSVNWLRVRVRVRARVRIRARVRVSLA